MKCTCHSISASFFFFYFRFPSSLGALFFFHHQFWVDHEFPPPICMNQVYVHWNYIQCTMIFAEPARADNVAIKLRKINSIMSYQLFEKEKVCDNMVEPQHINTRERAKWEMRFKSEWKYWSCNLHSCEG